MKKNNKVVIDFSKLDLSAEQLNHIHTAIQQSAANQLAKISENAIKENVPVIDAPAKTATLDVKITNTNPGSSSISAVLNGHKQTIISSGKIIFGEITSGDAILIQSYSLGTVSVSIDLSAEPQNIIFPPGHHNDEFEIN